MNAHGLFELESQRVDSYIAEYIRLTPSNNLEPIDRIFEHIDRIAIGRVR